jgi:hypothetical protein
MVTEEFEMNAIHERSIYGDIEFYELFPEYKTEKNSLKKQEFEGTIVAVGWDKYEQINKTSLYTVDDEDILLEHTLGIKKLKLYLNKKVKVIGNLTSLNSDERKVAVKSICLLENGFSKPSVPVLDEFDDLIVPADIH